MAKKNNLQLQSVNSNQAQLTISNKLKLRIDDLQIVEPLTNNQRRFFESYSSSSIMLLHGVLS